MEQLVASLAPGVDFTDRIGKPITSPDRKGNEPNTDARAYTQEESSPTKELKGVSPVFLDLPNSLCGLGASISQMLLTSHVKSRGNPHSDLANMSDEDSEDDTAFIFSRISNFDLHPHEVDVSSSATFDNSASERIIIGDRAQVEDVPHFAPTHKFIGRASAIRSLSFLEKLSSKSYNELGVHPKGARSEYWTIPSRFMDPPTDPALATSVWPEPDLADKLIDAFFGSINREFPMINEPLFRHEYGNQPELRKEPEWLALSFCIFMMGSQYVDDVRTRSNPRDKHSRGMLWWHAAKNLFFRSGTVDKPLWRIQCLLLSTLFQYNVPISASRSWILLGGAIRVLLDVGAHRKHAAKKLGLSRLEQETYKRVFWVAYSLDRELAASLGRPIMLQDEDIDVELPIEIDDDYLFDTPDAEPLPAQPQDKSAHISGFLSSLRLDEIVGRTLKTVYALHTTKIRSGIKSKIWDEHFVSEIDSALENWLDTVPPRLRYDPHERNDECLLQSSLLYSKYYNCQLLAHRPFIPAKKGASAKSILNFPSLAICTNAARHICHLVTNLKDRNLHTRISIPVAFRSVSAGSILLLVVWGAKRDGARVSRSASIDLRRTIDVLRAMEKQWQFCGKAVDVLESIMASTHLSVPRSASQSRQGVKRSCYGVEVQEVQTEDEAASTKPTQGTAVAKGEWSGKQAQKGRSQAEVAHAGNRDGHPLDPETRQLRLSTQQLASLTPQLSLEHLPGSVTSLSFARADSEQNGGDPCGPKSSRPTQTARMSTLSGATGLPASLSFGLVTPSALVHFGAAVIEADSVDGPHSVAYKSPSPVLTPNIFDNLGLISGLDCVVQAPAGNMPEMSQFHFAKDPRSGAVAEFGGGAGDVCGGGLDDFQAGAQARSATGDTPNSDGSGGSTSYMFEFFQNQSVQNMNDEPPNFL